MPPSRKDSELQETVLCGITKRIFEEQPLSVIFKYLCEELVYSVGYPVAIVGLKKAEGSVVIMAQAGVEEEYVRVLNLSWEDKSAVQGAMNEAICNGKTQVHCLINNPLFSPWIAVYKELKLQSLATFPLWTQGQCLGAIVLYSYLPDYFNPVRIECLQAMAEQITLAFISWREGFIYKQSTREVVAIYEDVTRRKQDEETLWLEKERAQITLASIGDAVITTDVQANITYLNPVAERLTGWTNKEAEGLPILSVFNTLNENTGQLVANPITQCLREKRIVMLTNPTVLTHRDGHAISIEDSAAPICNRGGDVIGAVLVFHDVSDKRALVNQLSHQAHHDALTGLPNRILFIDRAQQAIAQAHRHHTYVALLFLDLDWFKLINDTLGHTIGDQVLRAIGERLSACLREGDTVSRQGGDEFLILLPEMRSEDQVAQVAQKLMNLFTTPFHIQEQEIYITASLGIVLFPTDGEDIETLIKYADTAMYQAKDEGRNRYQFYTLAFNQALSERLALQNDLRRALAFEEFVLYYQPQYRISDGQMCGMEALVRWQHPEKGLLLPGEFIAIAEHSGLILPLGEWVLRSACLQNKRWQEKGYPPVRVAVNLSARQFRQANLISQIAQILTETGLDPQWLELEITESISMEDSHFTLTILQELKGMGIHLSMDDFGTGYSSLSYLSRFSLDTLKIDRSFVSALTTRLDEREHGNEIVTTIIQLAHNLGLRVIAEGVETQAQLDFLRAQGCAEVQGYLLAKPVSAEDLVFHLIEISLQLKKKRHNIVSLSS
jgi:diguanylate cyclase (GGDEF)-like protein/PAS domain S-box-containing protein